MSGEAAVRATPPRPLPALASVGAVVLVAAAYVLLFPDRTDYAGHFLAGAGGTFGLLALVTLTLPKRPWAVLAATWLAVLLGVGTEATIFRLAEFDPVDLANQSLGAVLAGLGLATSVRADRSWVVAAVACPILLVTGFGYAFA